MRTAEAIRLLESIRDHSIVALDVISDPNLNDRGRELEVAARANYISARLSQLQAEMVRPTEKSGRPDGGHLRALDDPDHVPAA